MPHAISNNQRRLMSEIRRRSGSASTRELGAVRDGAGRQPLTADVARKVLARAEARGFVKGDGSGRNRQWSLTPAGEEQLGEQRAAPTRDWTRPYVVLERVPLTQLIERGALTDQDGLLVYVEVTTVPARNTDHAFKLAAKVYAEDRNTTMVAVAERNFQAEPVHINSSRTVSVG